MNQKLGINSICLQLLSKNTIKTNLHIKYKGYYETNKSQTNSINLMWLINLFCQNQIDSHIVNIVLKAMAQVLLSWHAYNYYKPWVDYTVIPWSK